MIKYVKARTEFNQSTILYSYTEDFRFAPNDDYVLQTRFGSTIGQIALDSIALDEDKTHDVNKVLYKAQEKDFEAYQNCKDKAFDAFNITKEQIIKHNLPMKLINSHYFIDTNTVLFNFSAETRLDFRELVRTLASIFKTRIELRQIGKRDEAALLGGHGICGKELCCRQSGLTHFTQQTLGASSNQNTPASNTHKLVGLCDRVMCCCSYEVNPKPYSNPCQEQEQQNSKPFKRCDSCVNTLCTHFIEQSKISTNI